MDLLRMLDGIGRHISKQKDKTANIKAQEEALRKDLASAHAHLAGKRAAMEEGQRQHFSMISELQHQEAAIAECQAANGALKASISSVQQERTQLSELLRQLQDDFVQHSCQLSSDAQTLAAQVHDTNGSMHALSCLQRVSTDDVRAVAGQSALEEVIGGSIHDAADQGAVEHA